MLARQSLLDRGRSIVAFFALLLWGIQAMAIEEPEYEVVETHAAFELRQYAPYLVAEVEVRGGFESVGNRAFRILADYIFGNNRARERMAMTAPVTQRPGDGGSERIAMTAPVSQRPADAGESDAYWLSFVMPAGYTIESLPEPADSRVRLREVPGRLIAARRYSGRWSEASYRENETALLRALADAGLTVIGVPEYARYNSPFSLWFMRRNEVLVEVAR